MAISKTKPVSTKGMINILCGECFAALQLRDDIPNFQNVGNRHLSNFFEIFFKLS